MNNIKKLTLNKRRCPLCNNNGYNEIYNNKNYFKVNSAGQIYKINHKLVICKICNFIYSNPYLNEKNTKLLYASSVIGKAFENSTKSKKHFKRFQYLIDGHNPKINSVLEIGTATGNLLRDIVIKYKIKKKKAIGIEPSRVLFKQLKNNKYFKIYNLFIEKLRIKKKFDLIVMDNVLEHIEKPNMALKKLSEISNKKTLIYISVPNTLKVKPNFRDPLGHTCNYYKNNLIYIMQKNNFGIKSIKVDKWVSIIATKNTQNKKVNFVKDRKFILNSMKSKIKRISIFNKNIKRKINKIEKIIKSRKEKILVYGAGNFFLEIFLNSNLKKNITKIIDQNPEYRKKKRFGFEVISPENIIKEKFDKILIASGKFKKDIVNNLINLGVNKQKILKL